jgi:long-subunit fatty acid transport protein
MNGVSGVNYTLNDTEDLSSNYNSSVDCHLSPSQVPVGSTALDLQGLHFSIALALDIAILTGQIDMPASHNRHNQHVVNTSKTAADCFEFKNI